MSTSVNILSHKMARQQRRQTRQQRQCQPGPRMDLILPVELQIIILKNVSNYQDLTSLAASSPRLRAIYDDNKQTILAHVTQSVLGDTFVEACMLQHWESNIDRLRHLGLHQATGHRYERPGTNRPVPYGRWPEGPYRHIQLKFLHDWDQHAAASADDQIRNMTELLTVEDFEQIRTFYKATVQPLSILFMPELDPVRRLMKKWAQVGAVDPEPEHVTTATERQRIMRTLYRFHICCRLYGPRSKPRGQHIIDMGESHRLVIQKDFFGMFDEKENEEFDVVYAGLAFALHQAFHRISKYESWKKIMWRRTTLSAALYPGNFNYNWALGRPVGPRGMTAGALSQGLELVSRVRSAATADEVAAVLVASNPPELENFMWDAIDGLAEGFHFLGGGEGNWPESWFDAFWA